MRASRKRRPILFSRLAAMLLLPLTAWSVLPAAAASENFCPAPEAVEIAAHACCPSGPPASGAREDKPAAHAHANHAMSETMGAQSPASSSFNAPASPVASDNCACLPAPVRPAGPAELPAATGISPAPRVPDYCGTVSVLPAGIDLPSHAAISHAPDMNRRTAAGPPLFLLHELLLI